MLADHDHHAHALWLDEKLPIGHQIQCVNTHHKELICTTIGVRTCGCGVWSFSPLVTYLVTISLRPTVTSLITDY